MINNPLRAPTQNRSGVVNGGTTTSFHGSTMDGDDYCEPTACTATIKKPIRAPTQSKSGIVHENTTTSSRSTKQGLRKNVDVYCEPITASTSQPTEELVKVFEDKDYYLRFTPAENLPNNKQSCKQQTKNSVAKRTATENEYVKARLISGNPLVKDGVKTAKVVTRVVDAENTQMSYELLAVPTRKGNMKEGYRNMAYEKDTDLDAPDVTSNGEDVDKSTSAIVRALSVLKNLYVHIILAVL